MQYAILIYAEDTEYERAPKTDQERTMAGHKALQAALKERGPFASAKLMPTSAAVTLNRTNDYGQEALITDGPFSDTKERFLGYYSADFKDLDEAIHYARHLQSPLARIEIRPIEWAGGVLAG